MRMLKVKRLRDNINLPSRLRLGDAAWDLYSPEGFVLGPGSRYQLKLGLALELNQDECALVVERSGMALNNGIQSIGPLIDASYRGEISAILYNSSSVQLAVTPGSRVAQLLILQIPSHELVEVKEVSKTDRGTVGYGSSGI